MPFDTVTLNNATRVLPFFLVLSSDHITGATGKSPTVKVSKNGAAGVTPTGAVTEVDSVNLPGWYQIAANATDANTAGPLLLHASASACDPADYSFEVLAYNPDDAVRLGLTSLPNAAAGATGGMNPAVLLGGTASAGTATSLTLTGGTATDNTYNHATVELVGGTGAGQLRVVVNYSGSTKVAIVDRAWATTPDNTSVFTVIGPAAMPAWNLAAGLASAGTGTTITLAGASATDNIYNGAVTVVTAGTGARQARVITGYVGATKVATIDRAWAANPDSTSVFIVLGTDLPKTDSTLGVSLIANAVDASQFTQAAADKVWTSAARTLTAFSQAFSDQVWSSVARTLTSFGTLAADVWASPARTLTSFGTLVADVATAVWASATRTLTSFGTLVADGATAVWAYATRTLTQSAAQVIAVVSGTDVTLRRGETSAASFTALGSVVGRSKLWFTVKHLDSDLDTAAIIQIVETTGLVYLNGAAGTAGNGSLVVTDATTGAMTVNLAAVASATLVPDLVCTYDIQVLIGTTVTTLTYGRFTVRADQTRATS